MKVKNKIIVLISLIFVVALIATNVYAQSSFNCIVSPNKTTLKAGDTIEIKISFKDIQMGAEGVNVLEGNIIYDQNIFETLNSDSFEGLTSWNATYSNPKFIAVKLVTGITTDEDVVKVKFKVKENVELKDTQIIFQKLSSNDGENLVTLEDKLVSLAPQQESSVSSSSQSESKSESQSSSSTSSSVSSSKSSSVSKSSSEEIKVLPATGANNYVLFFIIGLALILGISFIIKKFNK